MFKKKIKYTDFNGIVREEEFYFHMSVPEALQLQSGFGGQTLEQYVLSLQSSGSENRMLKFLKMLILESYGEKSEDGKSFIKNQEIKEKFAGSQAYAELFEELILNPESAETFAAGIAHQTKNMKAPVLMVAPEEKPAQE